ncbi:hypothetical protein MJM28_28310, partial [Salmonella enterica subsp. enterica serovar Montevideo]|nr:hypothetical protein [Salmonella enterica subsp. enterica serovar Montevideo]
MDIYIVVRTYEVPLQITISLLLDASLEAAVRAHDDLMALQNGGVDAVMFSNEFSLPYLTKVRPETTTAMARI